MLEYIRFLHELNFTNQQERKLKSNATPIIDALKGKYLFIDNELQDGIQRLGLFGILSRQGLGKRSGEKIPQLIFAVLIWPFLKVDSISSFCGKMAGNFYAGGKDVLYRFLRREDINWRAICFSVSKAAYDRHALGAGSDTAFVVDDTLKHRRGKKVEGVSSHFDHTECRHVLGQQVLQLGHVSPKGFLPVFQQIYIGRKKVQELREAFKDNRSSVAKDYKTAIEKDKNEMLRSMLKKAVRQGMKAAHLLGDSWFGNKGNIRTALELGISAIFMMKRGNLSYRFQGRTYTAKMLYMLVKRRMKAAPGQRFLTHGIQVEIDLSTDGKTPEWVQVKLLFSKPRQANNDTWVVLLCTDIAYSPERILSIYALRWSIEVYFKEVKQSMGWMKEQSGRYTTHYASIHLAAIRYLLIYSLMLDDGRLKFGEMRNRITGAIEQLGFAAVLWEFFKALLNGVLDTFLNILGADVLARIKTAIGTTIDDFLSAALQADNESVCAQLKAEQLGVL